MKTNRITLHRDGSATLWDCTSSSWMRATRFSSRVLCALPTRERDRVIRHTARAVAGIIAEERGCHLARASNGRLAVEHCARGCGECRDVCAAVAREVFAETGLEVIC